MEWVIEHSQNLDQGMLLDCTVRDVLRKFAVINQVKAQSGGDILPMFKEGEMVRAGWMHILTDVRRRTSGISELLTTVFHISQIVNQRLLWK